MFVLLIIYFKSMDNSYPVYIDSYYKQEWSSDTVSWTHWIIKPNL